MGDGKYVQSTSMFLQQYPSERTNESPFPLGEQHSIDNMHEARGMPRARIQVSTGSALYMFSLDARSPRNDRGLIITNQLRGNFCGEETIVRSREICQPTPSDMQRANEYIHEYQAKLPEPINYCRKEHDLLAERQASYQPRKHNILQIINVHSDFEFFC